MQTITKLFSVYDSKVGGYSQPIFQPNTATAIRSFTGAVNEQGSDLNRWPSDYTLFELGEFDSEKGTIKPALTPISVCNGNDVFEQRVNATPFPVKGGE